VVIHDIAIFFLEETGLQRVRLLPRGFDANLAQTIAQMSKMEVHPINLSSATTDRRALAMAFYLFSKADLHEANNMMQEFLENRHAGIAQICVDYAIDLADDIPNDERWNAVNHPSHCKFNFDKLLYVIVLKWELSVTKFIFQQEQQRTSYPLKVHFY
ncbi:hypothetical protein WUBG_16264, partial [Wuchereria bancrofti]